VNDARRRKRESLLDSYQLKHAQDVTATWLQTSPEPYEPGTGCYLDDVDWEAEVRRYENQQRPGRMDFKAWALFRDGYRLWALRLESESSESASVRSWYSDNSPVSA